MIEVRDVCFSYGRYDVLKGVSFRAESGECVGILGNNGAGKSTLVTCLNRIRVPSSGTVLLDGKNIADMSRNELARSVAYVTQKNEMSHSTVYDCVLLGRKPYIRWGVSTEDLQSCDQVISLLGLQEMVL